MCRVYILDNHLVIEVADHVGIFAHSTLPVWVIDRHRRVVLATGDIVPYAPGRPANGTYTPPNLP